MRATNAPIPLTTEGLQALTAERERLLALERRGQLNDDTEYEPGDPRETDRWVRELRLYQIDETLRRAVLMPPGDAAGIVALGHAVTVSIDDDEETYTIVSAVEARPREGRISDQSPIGRALLGCRVGDRCVIVLPTGAEARVQIRWIAP